MNEMNTDKIMKLGQSVWWHTYYATFFLSETMKMINDTMNVNKIVKLGQSVW